MESLLLKPSEAAEQLRICRAKLYQLLADGTLRSVRLGRARRIPYEELVRFVAELQQEQSIRRGTG